jgi:hypothetical protein
MCFNVPEIAEHKQIQFLDLSVLYSSGYVKLDLQQ